MELLRALAGKDLGVQLALHTFNPLPAGDSSKSTMRGWEMLPKRAHSQPLALQHSKVACFGLPSQQRLPLATREWPGKLDRQVLPVSITTALVKCYSISSSGKTLKGVFGVLWIQILWIYALDAYHQTLKQERQQRLVCLGPQARGLGYSPDLQLPTTDPLPHSLLCFPYNAFWIRHHQSPQEVSSRVITAWPPAQ